MNAVPILLYLLLLLLGGALGMALWHIRNLRQRLEWMQGHLKQHRRKQESLMQAHALLANRVEERTTALSAANAEAAKANQAKDEFLAAMSHELRTPLTAVLGYAEGLLEEVYGDLTPQQREALGKIVRSGRRLLSVINDILDLSKIASNKVRLEHTPVSLRFICQNCLEKMRPLVSDKQLTLSLEFDPQIEYIHSDARRLQQILMNLLDNACKFSPPDSSVTLSVRGDAPGGRVSLAVKDQGYGIEEKDFDRIFEPFIQLENTLTRQHEGTGLGLALVYRLVEGLGGSLQVSSTPDEGSCFQVNLLWEDAPQPPPELPAARLRTDREVPAVLLVEDNPLNARFLSHYLQARGFRVSLIHDGETAHSEAERLRPLAILIDLQLPQLDGLALIRRVRAAPNLRKTRLIALTPLALPSDRDACLSAGVDAYLDKPGHLRHILDTLNQYKKERSS